VKITDVIWLRSVIDKLQWKHNVEIYEVEEVLNNRPHFRFIEKGQIEDEDLYTALGQNHSGRYLIVYFIYKKINEALIVSAREMTKKERKLYGKH